MTDRLKPTPASLRSGARPSWPARFLDSDIWASFRSSKLTMAAAFVTVLFFALAIAAGLVAPQNPFDPAELELMNSRLPPLWEAEGQAPFLLGTDEQGRDILSAILYGLRISLVVGLPRRGVLGDARDRPRPHRRLCRRHGRYDHHAHRRRAAHLPGDPDRAPDRRGREGRPRRPARRRRPCSPCWSSPSA